MPLLALLSVRTVVSGRQLVGKSCGPRPRAWLLLLLLPHPRHHNPIPKVAAPCCTPVSSRWPPSTGIGMAAPALLNNNPHDETDVHCPTTLPTTHYGWQQHEEGRAGEETVCSPGIC